MLWKKCQSNCYFHSISKIRQHPESLHEMAFPDANLTEVQIIEDTCFFEGLAFS